MKTPVFYLLTVLFITIMNTSCNDPDDHSLPPTVAALPATSIQSSSAVIHGTVNANGQTTAVYFEWGNTTAYGNEVKALPDFVDGTDMIPVSATISPIPEGFVYHYRIKAVNEAGVSYSEDMSFASPGIVVNHNDVASNTVKQYNSATYPDPGATAIDTDGSLLIVSVSGSVNMSSAGDYVLVYSATDSYGTLHSAERTVTVSGGLFLEGYYTVEDFVEGTSYGNYSETITVSSISSNRINFSKFGFYTNATVYGTISGTTITIPSQSILCGLPNKMHTFTGTGTFSNSSSFTVNFTDVSTDGTFQCQGVYVRL